MNQTFNIEKYESFLGEVKDDGAHWEKIQKRTATLFQILMEGDLRELVFVLKHYPMYIEVVCDHFRYLYNYSEQSADLYAASELLYMSEAYHQKQFVRNLLRKLSTVEEYEIGEMKAFIEKLLEDKKKIHPIVAGFYKLQIEENLKNGGYHTLQIIVVRKKLDLLEADESYDFSASDRDAMLDIPYMN